MSEQMSLENILNDKPEPPKEVPESKEVQVETKETPTPISSTRKAHQQKEREARESGEGRVRDPETGKYAKPEEKKEVKEEPKEAKPEVKLEVKPEPEQLSPKEKALLIAAQEERRKRQDIERQLQALQAPKPEQVQETKTFWDDPEGYLKRFEQNVQTVAIHTKVNTSEAISRSRHSDFDQIINVFQQLAQNTPGLMDQMVVQADPAEFAYQTGRNHLMLLQAKSLPQLKENLEKELRLKIEKELKEKAEKEAKEKAAIPGSLSDVTGTNPVKKVWDGPTPLDKILKG